jgi:hypothetical protein
LEFVTLAGAVWFARPMCLTCGELTMDSREWFLLVPLAIGEEDDVDILVGVATKHRTHAGVDAFLLREHDVPGAINSEPQPMPIHLVPVTYRVVDHLGVKNALVD